MATNRPSASSSRSSPVTVSVSFTPVTLPWSVPSTSVTMALVTKSMLSLALAWSIMILEARNSSRRCTSVTLVANLDRNVASSKAESPPPTTTTILRAGRRRPSQMAQ